MQPTLADPASSTSDDGREQSEDDDTAKAACRGRLSGRTMEGWIGRLLSAEHSETVTAAGQDARLDMRALLVHGRLCRCQISVAILSISSTVGEDCPVADQMAASGEQHTDADRLTPADAASLAHRALAVLMRQLDASKLNSSAVGSIKAYCVGAAGAILRNALTQAWRDESETFGELHSLPVFAVGMTANMDASVLIDCIAMATDQS